MSNFNFYEKVIAIKDALFELSDSINDEGMKSVKWIIVGDGKYLKILKEEAKKYQINVNFVGYQKDVKAFYSVADIILYFSYLDAYPNVVLEAQASGLPVICNKAVGMQDQVTHGVDGYFVNLNKGELKKYLTKLNLNKEERQRMGYNARKKVIENNDPLIIGKKFLVIFDEVLKTA